RRARCGDGGDDGGLPIPCADGHRAPNPWLTVGNRSPSIDALAVASARSSSLRGEEGGGSDDVGDANRGRDQDGRRDQLVPGRLRRRAGRDLTIPNRSPFAAFRDFTDRGLETSNHS